jgi:5-oxoprolinase (ATP-hydrolysing)
LTVTDADLFLGRLVPDLYPRIFGPKENQGLNEDVSQCLFQKLAEDINKELTKRGQSGDMNPDEVAYGFIKVANETMTRPIRSFTEAKGHDTSKHRLATFGRADGQHALLSLKA